MSEELTMKKYHFIITPTGERKLVFSPDVTYIDGKDAECLYNQIMNGEPSTETDEQAMKKIAEEDARLRTLEASQQPRLNRFAGYRRGLRGNP